ncbi:MAG: membrane protein insertion efficiency factor YidD [Dehalococcoidia bacterium]|nr:membrane protein insertion efficiency factor YidD [Dehalococcoidia bacterium]MEE2882016.1 membrane protein insertion efficiency factor YidD [Chloroflexota bacterium]
MKSGLLFTIKGYQAVISPYLPSMCRYTPSCSSYTFDAIEKYGVIRGIVMGAKRISRCQPWGGKGHDPVI